MQNQKFETLIAMYLLSGIDRLTGTDKPQYQEETFAEQWLGGGHVEMAFHLQDTAMDIRIAYDNHSFAHTAVPSTSEFLYQIVELPLAMFIVDQKPDVNEIRYKVRQMLKEWKRNAGIASKEDGE